MPKCCGAELRRDSSHSGRTHCEAFSAARAGRNHKDWFAKSEINRKPESVRQEHVLLIFLWVQYHASSGFLATSARVLDAVMTCADGYGSGDVAPTQQRVMAAEPAPILRSQFYKVRDRWVELVPCTVPASLSLAVPNRRRWPWIQ